MFQALLPPVLAALVLAISLVSAQEINSALGPAPTSATIFDEIRDPRERSAFREVWNASDPRAQRERAVRDRRCRTGAICSR